MAREECMVGSTRRACARMRAWVKVHTGSWREMCAEVHAASHSVGFADANHGSMPYSTQTPPQLLLHCAIAISAQLAPFVMTSTRPTPKAANRLRRRGDGVVPCPCRARGSLQTSTTDGPALRARRGQAARCTSPMTEVKSACLRARAGCAQRSAGEEACTDRAAVSSQVRRRLGKEHERSTEPP